MAVRPVIQPFIAPTHVSVWHQAKSMYSHSMMHLQFSKSGCKPASFRVDASLHMLKQTLADALICLKRPMDDVSAIAEAVGGSWSAVQE